MLVILAGVYSLIAGLAVPRAVDFATGGSSSAQSPARRGPGYGLGSGAVLCGVCASTAYTVGWRPELVLWLVVAWLLVVLACVDLAVRRLPDVITLPLAALVVAGLALASQLPRTGGSFGAAILGGALLVGSYFLLFLAVPDGIGFGDVKTALTTGAIAGWYGWHPFVVGALTAPLLGVGYVLVVRMRRAAQGAVAFAYGPFLALGAWVAVLVGAVR
ncbi:A24 family peptidase [Streptomyces sp. NBC_00006]|uniref:prepilin peptidase n=1 Tax=unclassified Streptomyces TaxID=2593676 RepID=UPI00225AD1C3|nr:MULTISPECIES: A24 family peptidase [unclassified Streptomyces]MCX4834237.1 A24 family peptidase [Streptomyces sp. NBC_01016]MCX5529847.1 A24 family peptidase [Streptomyces sp. NBC_00006]